jgi:hypothetical protein
MVGTRAALVFVGAGLVANPAAAGTISMRTDVRAAVLGNRLAVTMKVVNSGDEAAHSVVSAAVLGVRTVAEPRVSTLLPGASLDVSLELPWSPAAAGRWPLVTTVDYADVNGHPFQAMHVSLVPVDGDPALIAVVDIEADPIASSGDIVVRLKSLSAVSLRTTLTLLVPRDLEPAVAAHNLELEPWADAEVKTNIVNRTALAGSRYPVFVTVEYDELDGHRAVVGTGTVTVTGTGSRPVVPFVFAVAAILTVAWLFFVVRRPSGTAGGAAAGASPP